MINKFPPLEVGDRVVAIEDGKNVLYNYKKGNEGVVENKGNLVVWDREEINNCVPPREDIKKIKSDFEKTIEEAIEKGKVNPPISNINERWGYE